jgi:hypothetical protein
MIPRPIFKILVLPVWALLSFGFLALWWQWLPALDKYYLTPRSGCLYERLFLPRLPFHRPGEQWTVLMYACPGGYCLATPADQEAHKTLVLWSWKAPREVVRKKLAYILFGGSFWGSMWWVYVGSIMLFLWMIPCAVLLDLRRRRRILKGVQVLGRWPVAPDRFSGWFARWRKNTMAIAVRTPSKRDAPL